MKKIVLIFSLVGCFTVGYSQIPLTYTTPHNNSENLNDANNMLVRYWYYRWRLQNDFLIIGDQPRYSIPAEDREGEQVHSLRWGDGTIWLGNYICMLALENALIRYSNRYFDLKKNERELYYAMQAFNRLDEQGDTYYDAGPPPNGNGSYMPSSKNGFFIRDDVPANFFVTNYTDEFGGINNLFNVYDVSTWIKTTEYTHFNGTKSGINYHYYPFLAVSCGGFSNPIYDINVNPSNPSYPFIVPNDKKTYIPISKQDEDDMDALHPYSRTYAMSQDQVYRLLLGFSTVIKSIPYGNIMVDTDDDGYGDTPFNFVEEAKIHSTNIIARTSGIDQNTLAHGANINYGPLWFMHDPLNEAPGIGNFSGDFAPEVSMIWTQNYTIQNNLNVPLAHVLNILASSHNPIAVAANVIGQAFTAQDQTNAKLYLYTSLVSGFVPYKMNTVDGVFNHIFAFSKGNIVNDEKTFGWHTYMTPLYCYLHNFHPQHTTAINNWVSTRQDMQTQVSSAPCWGPYNYVVSDANSNPLTSTPAFQANYGSWIPPMGINGWNTSFRFDQREYRTIHGFELGDKKHDDLIKQVDGGFFNGIDYMSEVNLYYITSNIFGNFPSTLPFYQNLIDRYVDYDVSSDNTPMLGAFNTMSIHNSITGSGQLDIQAGSSIHLQDGTHITASQASKHLFIKTFSCNNIVNGGYELPVVSDSRLEAKEQRFLMNNDYGFNEEFSTMQYDVHPYMDNAPTTQEILARLQAITEKKSDSIILYPNPTQKEFSIKNIENTTPVECKVYILSADGKNIQVEETRGKYDISTLSPGTYIVHLIFPSGAVTDKKLIVLP